MLNKNQSKRLNSLKYALILPVLAAFMLMFQVKVVAQEKAAVVNSSSQEKTKISIAVTKDAKDDELAAEAKIFKEEFDADVTFSNVTRNASGEITAIKVTVKDKTQSQDHFVSGANPIKPFTIELEKNSNSQDTAIVFGNPNETHGTADKMSTGCAEKCKKTSKTITLSSGNTNDSIGYYMSAPNTTNIYKDALVVVNGVQQKEQNADFNKVQLPKGQSIGFMKILSPKEAKKKYGKAGKKGAVEIETRNTPSMPPLPPNAIYAYNDNGDIIAPVKFEMPDIDMENIMTIAANGVNVGMDVLANIDWEKEMRFEGLSDDERREIQEEMKKAHVEVQKAMKDIKVDFDREEYVRARKEAFKDSEWSQKDVEKAKAEMKQAQKELEKARKELEKAQKELEKTKAKNKKAK